MSLNRFLKRLDARYGIPRPVNALYLDSYQAALRLMNDASKGLAMIAAGGVSSLIWWEIGDMLHQVGIEIQFYLLFVMIFCAIIGIADAASLLIPYYRLSQHVTYGSARWAGAAELKESGLAFDNRQQLPRGALRIGRLTRRYDLALPYNHVLRHIAILGPPGSGKSSSFFMNMAKDWSRRGSAIFLDPKGELYRHTAGHFRRVYRLDLTAPQLSDNWNFVPACIRNAELASEIASIVVGYDAKENVGRDTFWQQAEAALLISLLLHLPQISENPTPAHLAEFIATRSFDQIDQEMLESPDPEARVKWGIFKKANREKTQGEIYIGLGMKLDPFRSPHAMAVMRSVSAEDRGRGFQEIDLYDLRKPSTGIYVVVPEGEATRYKIVFSILFGLAASVARKTSDDEYGAPMLLMLDEAGNIPIHNLSEALGVGRGRRCGIVLGYQNIGQIYKQYGRDGAQAILGSIGSMIFLPGLDAETSQYAARRIGKTTAFQYKNVDATGTTYDHEGLTETGRNLIEAEELRQLPEHTQVVGIFGSVPPVKFGFPPFAKVGRQFRALPHELSPPLTLAEAEAALALRRSEVGDGGENENEPLTARAESDAFDGAVESNAPPTPKLLTTGAESGAFDDAHSHSQASEGARDWLTPSVSLGAEIELDLDEYLSAADESIGLPISILDFPSKAARANDAIRRSIELLKSMFNSSSAPVAGVETDGNGLLETPQPPPQVDSIGAGAVEHQSALPDMSAAAAQIDPVSVLEIGDQDILDLDLLDQDILDLDLLDDAINGPVANHSGQLAFGRGSGAPNEKMATTGERPDEL